MATTPEPPTDLTIRKPILSELAKTGASIVLVYSTHYASSKVYNLVCVPGGFLGYLFGFVTTASPWCRLILEIMKLTENQYSTIILIVLSRLLMQALGV